MSTSSCRKTACIMFWISSLLDFLVYLNIAYSSRLLLSTQGSSTICTQSKDATWARNRCWQHLLASVWGCAVARMPALGWYFEAARSALQLGGSKGRWQGVATSRQFCNGGAC